MKGKKMPKPYNPVDRFMREGEDGWKKTVQTHKQLKKYSKKERVGNKLTQIDPDL